MEGDKSLRRQQKIQLIEKAWKGSADNPMNQVHGKYNMTKAELAEMQQQEKEKKEKRLLGVN